MWDHYILSYLAQQTDDASIEMVAHPFHGKLNRENDILPLSVRA